jgi:hypothetical protein
VHLCESDVRVDPLEFLQLQGVTPTSVPDGVRRLISAGVRPPSHFGAPEVARYFPDAAWCVLASGPTTMYGVPLERGGAVQQLPGHYAVLRARGFWSRCLTSRGSFWSSRLTTWRFLMPVLPAPTTHTHALEHARFTSLATPSLGASEVSVWRVELAPGRSASRTS